MPNQSKHQNNIISTRKRVKSERETTHTSVKNMNLVGLTVIFAITTKDIDMSTTINGVTGMTPPFPWPSITLFCNRLNLDFFPPHFLEKII
jgi:hypothetical protein